jgi:hypothetical protein
MLSTFQRQNDVAVYFEGNTDFSSMICSSLYNVGGFEILVGGGGVAGGVGGRDGEGWVLHVH